MHDAVLLRRVVAMSRPTHPRPHRVGVAALVALAAGSVAAGNVRLDRADFDAVTTCGPVGVVTLWIEAREQRGCDDSYPLVHGEGAQAVGLPAIGETDDDATVPVQFPGDELLGHPIALYGRAPVAGATPERTVERTCRTSRASRDVLAVACEGPDPEAACSGTLTLRAGTP